MLPLIGSAQDIGVLHATEPKTGAAPGRRGLLAAATGSAGNAGHGAEVHVAQVRVSNGAPIERAYGLVEGAQGLATDQRGHAYVVVGDAMGIEASTIAVIDMQTGQIERRLPVATAGERVLALEAAPDGERLYVSLWHWHQVPFSRRGAGAGNAGVPSGGNAGAHGSGPLGVGRLVLLDARTGRVLAQTEAPDGWAVTKLALAAPPPGTALSAGSDTAVYATMTTPPLHDLDEWRYVSRRSSLLVYDSQHLESLAVWPMGDELITLAVQPDGKRVFFLAGKTYSVSWSRELVSMDLASGGTQAHALPGGCLSLAMGPVDKVYVADTLGDRLWRLDPSTGVLSSIPLPGAPMALAARPG
jgi:DNA-binding beta-propeller fold protein YncE